MQLVINRKPIKPLSKIELQQIYQQTFNSKDGIMILDDLANISGMYRSNFVQNESRHTAFLEGQRSLFLYICSQLEENDINNIEGKNNL